MLSSRKPEGAVTLDEYISDLNLEISRDGCSCQPMHKDGFAYMWAGAKATHGIRRGKVCYEVKIVENLPVSTSEFTDAHIVRVGWSTDASTLQLGEDKKSFGYGGTAKKSESRSFTDYGRRFDAGDVIGCYLSVGGGWVDISFCVNGYQCGTAFKVRWNTDEALFPHVLTKNCRIEVNFGQAHNPYFSILPGYKFIGNLPQEMRVAAVKPPNSKHDCEVIMMVGLPGVGKTTWAINYAKLHPNKKYNILGTDAIIDKMRVQGLPRKQNFGGRWDVLIKQATECFNIMLRKASTCNRNLILDQTNVYASARKRKVHQYKDAGYKVLAMVLVPTDAEMISRSNHRTATEGKEVPEAAINDMKANFSLPHENENLFTSITFLELQRPDAESLVMQYNVDAGIKGYKSNKQSRQGANENQKEISEKRQIQGRQTQGRGFETSSQVRTRSPIVPVKKTNDEWSNRGASHASNRIPDYNQDQSHNRSNRHTDYPGDKERRQDTFQRSDRSGSSYDMRPPNQRLAEDERGYGSLKGDGYGRDNRQGFKDDQPTQTRMPPDGRGGNQKFPPNTNYKEQPFERQNNHRLNFNTRSDQFPSDQGNAYSSKGLPLEEAHESSRNRHNLGSAARNEGQPPLNQRNRQENLNRSWGNPGSDQQQHYYAENRVGNTNERHRDSGAFHNDERFPPDDNVGPQWQEQGDRGVPRQHQQPGNRWGDGNESSSWQNTSESWGTQSNVPYQEAPLKEEFSKMQFAGGLPADPGNRQHWHHNQHPNQRYSNQRSHELNEEDFTNPEIREKKAETTRPELANHMDYQNNGRTGRPQPVQGNIFDSLPSTLAGFNIEDLKATLANVRQQVEQGNRMADALHQPERRDQMTGGQNQMGDYHGNMGNLLNKMVRHHDEMMNQSNERGRNMAHRTINEMEHPQSMNRDGLVGQSYHLNYHDNASMAPQPNMAPGQSSEQLYGNSEPLMKNDDWYHQQDYETDSRRIPEREQYRDNYDGRNISREKNVNPTRQPGIGKNDSFASESSTRERRDRRRSPAKRTSPSRIPDKRLRKHSWTEGRENDDERRRRRRTPPRRPSDRRNDGDSRGEKQQDEFGRDIKQRKSARSPERSLKESEQNRRRHRESRSDSRSHSELSESKSRDRPYSTRSDREKRSPERKYLKETAVGRRDDSSHVEDTTRNKTDVQPRMNSERPRNETVDNHSRPGDVRDKVKASPSLHVSESDVPRRPNKRPLLATPNIEEGNIHAKPLPKLMSMKDKTPGQDFQPQMPAGVRSNPVKDASWTEEPRAAHKPNRKVGLLGPRPSNLVEQMPATPNRPRAMMPSHRAERPALLETPQMGAMGYRGEAPRPESSGFTGARLRYGEPQRMGNPRFVDAGPRQFGGHQRPHRPPMRPFREPHPESFNQHNPRFNFNQDPRHRMRAPNASRFVRPGPMMQHDGSRKPPPNMPWGGSRALLPGPPARPIRM